MSIHNCCFWWNYIINFRFLQEKINPLLVSINGNMYLVCFVNFRIQVHDSSPITLFFNTVSAILCHSYQSPPEGWIILRYSLKSHSGSPCWAVTLTEKLNCMKTMRQKYNIRLSRLCKLFKHCLQSLFMGRWVASLSKPIFSCQGSVLTDRANRPMSIYIKMLS